jgi:hypothetical protein
MVKIYTGRAGYPAYDISQVEKTGDQDKFMTNPLQPAIMTLPLLWRNSEFSIHLVHNRII